MKQLISFLFAIFMAFSCNVFVKANNTSIPFVGLKKTAATVILGSVALGAFTFPLIYMKYNNYFSQPSINKNAIKNDIGIFLRYIYIPIGLLQVGLFAKSKSVKELVINNPHASIGMFLLTFLPGLLIF